MMNDWYSCSNYMQCIFGNFQYGGVHKAHFLLLLNDSILKKYEKIALIYNEKPCRLDLLCFCLPKGIILLAIRPGSTKFKIKHI